MAIKRCLIATTKNLLDQSKFKSSSGTVSVNGDRISIIINSSYTSDTFALFCTVSVKKNTNYTLSTQGNSYDIPSVYIYTDRIFGNRLTNGFPPFTFNSGDNESLVICFYSLYSRRQKGVESWIQGPQLEEGSTATSYVPYGYLPSYKKIIKVNNNPVQLLDKSKYPATTTINGVTFTNNGDGTISVMNGTATSNATYNLMLPINNKTVIGNKYCLVGGAKGGAGNTYFLRYDSDGGMAAYDFGDGVIFTRAAERLAYVNIRVQSGTTANNLFFIPQLYDLTKTFGAGNEPSTVAEFRAKYPNELYEYNPSQIRTAYKKQLITTEGKSI